MAGSGRDERAWVRGAQAGSASDLEALFRAHWPRAHRAAYLVVGDAGAAEDIAQEAFLAAVRSLDRFDRRRPFGPWLHRIVVNRAIDWARARRLRAEAELTEGLPAPPEPDQLPSPDSPPVLWLIAPCFEAQGGESLIDPQTYVHYIQTLDRYGSRPSQGEWTPWSEAVEESLIGDFRRLWNTGFLDNLSVEVEDFQCYEAPSRKKNSVKFDDGAVVPIHVFADVLKTAKATPIASWERDYLKGAPACTQNKVGKGNAVYYASFFNLESARYLIRRYAAEHGLKPLMAGVPPEVEVTRRTKGTAHYYFLLNHDEEPVPVKPGSGYFDLLDGAEAPAAFTLKPFEYKVLRRTQ